MNYIHHIHYNVEDVLKHIRVLSSLYTNDLIFNIALVRSEVGHSVAVLQRVPHISDMCMAYIQHNTGYLEFVYIFSSDICVLLTLE